MNKKNVLQSIKVIVLGLVFGFFITSSFVKAQTVNNIPGPLNVGDSLQTKSGLLRVGGFHSYGPSLFDDIVVIGTDPSVVKTDNINTNTNVQGNNGSKKNLASNLGFFGKLASFLGIDKADAQSLTQSSTSLSLGSLASGTNTLTVFGNGRINGNVTVGNLAGTGDRQVCVDDIGQLKVCGTSSTLTKPVVSTLVASGATVGGHITSNGGITQLESLVKLTEVGIDWGLTSSSFNNHMISNSLPDESNSFFMTLSIPPNTTMYYRAYATNSLGTGYGQTLSYTTGSSCGTADGQSYYSVPTSNLCPSGVAHSSVTGTGPWYWTCGAASCSAELKGSCKNISSFGTPVPDGNPAAGLASGSCGSGLGTDPNYAHGVSYAPNSSSCFSPTNYTANNSNSLIPVSGVTATQANSYLCNSGIIDSLNQSKFFNTWNSQSDHGFIVNSWSWICKGSSGGTNASCSATTF